jgi:hypothetical protein
MLPYFTISWPGLGLATKLPVPLPLCWSSTVRLGPRRKLQRRLRRLRRLRLLLLLLRRRRQLLWQRRQDYAAGVAAAASAAVVVASTSGWSGCYCCMSGGSHAAHCTVTAGAVCHCSGRTHSRPPTPTADAVATPSDSDEDYASNDSDDTVPIPPGQLMLPRAGPCWPRPTALHLSLLPPHLLVCSASA